VLLLELHFVFVGIFTFFAGEMWKSRM